MQENEVIYFINKFINHSENINDHEFIYNQFRRGYCYYFAHMLKEAFNRGKVCWCAPLGHIVWVDDDGIPYDIDGINYSEVIAYIPIEYLGEYVDDFKHIQNPRTNGITKKEIIEICKKYFISIGKPFTREDLKYWHLFGEE